MQMPKFLSRALARGFGWRIMILMVVGFLALLASNGVSLWAAALLDEQMAAVEHTRDVRRVLDQTERSIIEAESAQRSYLITREEMYARQEASARAEAADSFGRLRDLISDNPEQVDRLDEVRPIMDERLQLTQQIVRYVREGRIEEGADLVRTGRGADLMQRIGSRFETIDASERALLERRRAAVERAERLNFWFSTLGTVLIIGVAGLSLWQFWRFVGELNMARTVVERANIDLERRVQERTADLIAANEEVQRFAYIVSHDLRAPLVNVMGYTSELQAAGKAIEKQLAVIEEKAPDKVLPEAVLAVREDMPEAIGFIRTSTEKMDRLINAILKLSREGRRNLSPQALDMTGLVQAIADSVNHQTEELGAEILVEALPEIESDRLMVEQVFGNLIDNAVKYLAPERPGRIVVRGFETGDGMVRFEVSDNGRGVAEKDHERIFELFRRSGKQDRPGEGLGLAFVRNTVRRLGGTISVTSALAEGSTFCVNLPKRLLADNAGGSDE